MIKRITIIFLAALLVNISVFADNLSEIEKNISKITDGSFTENTDFAENASKTAQTALQPQNILLYTVDSLKNTINGSSRNLLTVLIIIFLASLTEVFSQNLGKSSELIDYVSLLSLMFVCFGMITPLLESVSSFLDKHTAFMLSMTGSSSAILAASGSVTSAASSSVSSAFITAFTEICAVNIILPAVKIIIVLSSVSSISKSVDLSGVISFLKSFCSYGIGLLFAVFLAVHSLTLNLASSADSLAFRSLRFTVARLVPVAGGMISESIKTVLAGMNLIKSASGAIGIAYIIYTVIPCILLVMSLKLTLLCGLTVSKIFGTRRHTAFLDGLNNACTLIFAVCIFASFGGIIILAVFMRTSLNL